MDSEVYNSEEDVMEPDTPRPSLDTHSPYSHTVHTARKRALKKRIVLTPEEKKMSRRVLSKYRRRQERLLDDYDSDPNPYDSDYIFYCLETPPRK